LAEREHHDQTAEAAEAMRAALDGSINSIAPDHWIDRAISCVTVFGGTGFLGRRVVHQLRDSGATVRIASRHPGQADDANVKQVRADAHDECSVEAAAAGADGVVNAISLYVDGIIRDFAARLWCERQYLQSVSLALKPSKRFLFPTPKSPCRRSDNRLRMGPDPSQNVSVEFLSRPSTL
jgi:NAD(P)H-binding